jgi:Na+/proline symporter
MSEEVILAVHEVPPEALRPLPIWVGPPLILGLGGLFAFLVWIIGKWKGSTAETMITGGREIGHGMANAAIVATWVWAATLMMSSWTGYVYGPSGPWWYSMGATIPLPIFAYLGQSMKSKMPLIHTYPEFIRFRLDAKNHICMGAISLTVCSWVAIMIVSGGSILYMTYTGIPFNVAATLMCITFLTYTLVAGTWASIFADTIMGMGIYVALGVVVFGTLLLMGPKAIWDGLTTIYTTQPILQPFGAYTNEFYVTSQWDCINYLNAAGIGFLIVNTVGNLGAVLNNQTYWSICIATDRPRTVFTSFLAAALCWAPIPLSMATSRGVAGLAQLHTVGATYTSIYLDHPGQIYFQEAEAIMPLSGFTIVGWYGLIGCTLAVGFATVSTGSHELMSASSNFVNDFYRYYIRPQASAKELLRATRFGLVLFMFIVLGFTITWRAIGFTFAGMYQAMGIFFSSAVIPLCMAVWWKDANRDGCFWGVVIGAALGIYYWASVGFNLGWGVVWANIIVMAVSCIAIPWSIAKPENFDYKAMAKLDIMIHEE